jgi:hypothetical protein
MKYFMWLLWLFPRAEGEGEGDGDGAGDGDSAGDGDGSGDGDGATGDRQPIGGDDPDRKPDWLADKFWNPDLKAPRTEQLGKAYNDLEGKMRGKGDELREEIREQMRADAPEKYAVNLSEDLKIPDNVELDFSEDDPLVSWFFGFAKENGMSQDTVDKALNEYVGIELGNMTDVQAEIEKLGDHGQDRMLRVHNWLETKLSEDQFAALNPLLGSAMQVEALEVLMKGAGPMDFDGDSGGAPLSLDELRAMQNDKRYWQEKDPAFIAKVEAGYKRLYKNQ